MPEQAEEKALWTKQVADLKKTLATSTPALEKEQAAWEGRLRQAPAWTRLSPKEAKGAHGPLKIEDEGYVRSEKLDSDKDTYRITTPIDQSACRKGRARPGHFGGPRCFARARGGRGP